MIFIFSEDEKRQLERLDQEQSIALKNLHDIHDKYGKNSAEFSTAHKKFQEETIARDERLNELINDFDQDRFSQLQTEEDIIQDAKEQAEDAIIYAYVRLAYIPFKNVKCIIGVNNKSFPLYVNNWNFEEQFLKQKEKNSVPDGGNYYLNELDLEKYIMSEVLKLHNRKLKIDRRKELKQIVIDAMKASPYTTFAYHPTKERETGEGQLLSQDTFKIYHNTYTDFILKGETAARKKLTEQVLEDLEEISDNINVHKLLITAVGEFCRNNKYKSCTNLTVEIPLEEYALKLGYDIKEKETSCYADYVKEKRRVETSMYRIKKYIRSDLDTLLSKKVRYDYSSKNGKKVDYKRVNYFDSGYFSEDGKNIVIVFGSSMGYILSHFKKTMNYYPVALLSMDSKKKNAYRLGYKMTLYSNMDANIRKGKSNYISVKNLLKETDLPTMKALEVQNDCRHWNRRIKALFEKAMNANIDITISSWKYMKPNKEAFTRAELKNMNYDDFAEAMIHFEPINCIDHSDRLIAKDKEIIKAVTAKKSEKTTV